MLVFLSYRHSVHLLIVSFCLASISPLLARLALNMLQPYRKNHVTCISLLSELSEGPSRTPTISRTIPSSNGVSLIQEVSFHLWWYVFKFYKMLDHRYRCTSVLLILIISGCRGWNQQAVDGKKIGRNLNYSWVIFGVFSATLINYV